MAPALTSSSSPKQLLYHHPTLHPVSPWNFLQGSAGNYFSSLFVLCSFRNTAFVSLCLHQASLRALQTSFCEEFSLSNAHLRNANFYKWEMFSNIMGTVYAFVEIRESGNVTQWWHYSNSTNSQKLTEMLSLTYRIFLCGLLLLLAAACDNQLVRRRAQITAHSKCLPFPCAFQRDAARFKGRQEISLPSHLPISKAS